MKRRKILQDDGDIHQMVKDYLTLRCDAKTAYAYDELFFDYDDYLNGYLQNNADLLDKDLWDQGRGIDLSIMTLTGDSFWDLEKMRFHVLYNSTALANEHKFHPITKTFTAEQRDAHAVELIKRTGQDDMFPHLLSYMITTDRIQGRLATEIDDHFPNGQRGDWKKSDKPKRHEGMALLSYQIQNSALVGRDYIYALASFATEHKNESDIVWPSAQAQSDFHYLKKTEFMHEAMVFCIENPMSVEGQQIGAIMNQMDDYKRRQKGFGFNN